MIKKHLQKIFIYILALVIGLVTGCCIAYEILYKKFNEKKIKIEKEVNKIV